jgi:aromatic ring-opening dioxygenase catalytic subunit (LigB family)
VKQLEAIMTQPCRQPAIFLSHGGGPCFWITLPPPFGPGAFDHLKAYLSGLLGTLPERPKAILVISGHWEEKLPTVSTAAAPSMLFDYYGFPEHTYRLSYPAPGDPDLAKKVHSLLTAAGIPTATDANRGYDHGVFVPFLIVDPEAHIPVVMLSMQQDLDPAFHIAIGRAIAPLRNEGVLIVGSGNTFHNLQAFRDRDSDPTAAAAFDVWLNEAIVGTESDRRNRSLEHWVEAPYARDCQPREDHLLPLMVISGAGLDDVGRRVYHDRIGGKLIAGFAFG